MPYKMRKVYKQNCYKVFNTTKKRVFAKCSTKNNAIRQLAIIRNKVYSIKKSSINTKRKGNSKTMRTTTIK